MNRSPKTPLARWALTALGLLAGCGAQAGNNGGATNWLECSNDSDCASNSCVERRCETFDAGTLPASASADDAAAPSADSTEEPRDSTTEPDAADATDATDATSPSTAPDPSARPSRLALGEQHACALFDDGTVWCWGNNDLGQLGDGSGESALHPVDTGLFEVAQLAAGRNHTCAMKVNGEVWCWGDDSGGQLARDFNAETELDPKPSVPVRASFDAGDDWTLYAGADATCAVERSTSHTVCWGTDPSGAVYVPTQLPQIALVFEQSVANLTLTTDDFVFINYSQRVYRIADWSSDVVLDPDIGSGSRAILIAANQQCRIKDDDSVWCRDESSTYVWQRELSGTNLVLGDGFVCQGLGLRSRCIGDNPAIPELPLNFEAPSEVYGTAVASADHACAISVEGSIWCWGNRGVGEEKDLLQVHEATLEPFPLQGSELSPTTGDDYVNAAIAQRQEQCRCQERELPSCYAETMPLTTGACIDALRWPFDVVCATQQLWDQNFAGCGQDWSSTCDLPEDQPWLRLCSGESKHCPGGEVTFGGHQWCDGAAECPDGFDELNCVAASTYTCADNTTIDAALVCDGQADCVDDSDELNCE